MATTPSPAANGWQSALKLRKHLTKRLEKLSAQTVSGVDLDDFEALNTILEKFRFTCVHTIFTDLDYAVAENTEQILWSVHTSVNHEYRRTLGRLKRSPNTVERRKVEKSYDSYLRISQKFYKGFIQRLAARYDIQQLSRVAQGLEIDQQNDSDTISPVPPELHIKVLDSCHATLIRLGDLARYRSQARNKKHGYDMALTYYSLAQDLKPNSGFAFHQMGIVNLDEEKHLDIVYHFYRAWAVADPHPNAQPNLESEFKALATNTNKPNNRQGPPAPHDAFIMWFVRLHAHFYKGEVFPQHGELEGEVIHRLDMAARNADTGDVLMKMSLTNVSSYYVASLRYTENQTPAAARFCQYTLRLNVRFILALCMALEPDLQEIVDGASQGSGSHSPTKTTPVLESLLPILRIYTMWLAAYRREVFGAANALGGVVPGMVKALARIFTLLCAQTYAEENLAFCPYLLKEDIETSGLRPLSEDHVPLQCRCYIGEDGLTKPHESKNSRLGPFRETMARILDILRSAYFLAEDANVPLVHQVTEKFLSFVYQENAGGGHVMTATTAPAAELPATELPTAEPPIAELPTAYNEMQHFEERNSSTPRAAMSSHATEQPTVHGSTSLLTSRANEEQASIDADHAQHTVYEMLAPFLKPPSPQPHPGPRFPEESSYGMNTATANDVFGTTQNGASPNSITSAKFTALPWNYFYTPTPHKNKGPTTSAGKAAFDGQKSSAYSSRGPVQGGDALEDLFDTPGRLPAPGFTPRSVGQILRSPGIPAEEEAHRNILLQTLTSSAPSSAPRTSAFSQWGENSLRQPKETVSSSWVQRPLEGHSLSPGASGFSHPSSLYQGTPTNGANSGVPGNGQYPMSFFSGSNSQENVAANRHSQMNYRTSNYDAAVLQAALYGNNRGV